MTVDSKIPKISIDNLHDLNIWERELSYCKIFNSLNDSNGLKNYDSCYVYVRSHLGISTKKEFVESLITRFQNEKMITVTKNSFELTEKFLIYMKRIQKNIKLFRKKRHDECMNDLPQPIKSEGEVNGDVDKKERNLTATN
jgi:hypothetical protein